MVFVATLPGAVVLVAVWLRRTRSAPWLDPPVPAQVGVLAQRDGGADV